MAAAIGTTTIAAYDNLMVCPDCHGRLRHADALVCCSCGRKYEIIDGIPCFASADRFYDQYAAEHCPFAASPTGFKRALLHVLPFWSYREWKFWRRVIPRCDRLLEFGCGRGRQVFLDRAKEPVGYDGSLVFLQDCAKRYSRVALGQLPCLPFASGSFDVVASSHTFGHVALEGKDKLVSEIARVLRPRGVTAHIIETDSDHPAVQAAKRAPQAYQRQFIDQHGHIGLEYATQVIERFERHGFHLRNCAVVDAVLPSVLNFRRFFDVPELAGLSEVRWSKRISEWSAASRIINAAYEVGFGAFHATAEQWFGNPRYAQFLMVSFTKS